MSKGDLVQDIKLIGKGLKEIQKLQSWIIPSVIMDSALKAIAPFVNIYMSAKIIDELLATRNINTLIIYVAITIGINLAVYLLSTGMNHIVRILGVVMLSNQDMVLNKKIIDMDYEHIENPEVHLLRTKIKESEIQAGGIHLLIIHFGRLVKGLIMVALSLFLIIEMFKPDNISSNFSILNSNLLNITFLILLVIGTVYNMILRDSSERKYFGSMNKLMDINRVYFYYLERVKDYNSGKGIRIYNQGDLFNHGLNSFIEGARQVIDEIISNNMKYSGANGFISSLLSSLTYIFVGLKAIAGSISIGNVMKYAGSINEFMNSSSVLLSSITTLRTNNQYLQLYLDFLDIEGEKYKGTLPIEKRDDDEYEIEFRNVSFKYPGTDEYVLKNISMKLNIGERLAIVGMNGSGKTTFIKLLSRLYDPNEGEILLNGIDIKKYDYDEYLKLFSIVFQDFKLFSFSLGQNIAASVDYNEDRVVEMAKEAGLGERLETMTSGIHTPLYKDFDEDGVEISGGEAQKIALARALYRDSPIMILDEPTAALDPIAEYEVYSKFDGIVGSKTAFYISHRLSSCRFCDEVAVFHKGRIVQKGEHHKLLENIDGKYYELWHSQAQYYNEEVRV